MQSSRPKNTTTSLEGDVFRGVDLAHLVLGTGGLVLRLLVMLHVAVREAGELVLRNGRLRQRGQEAELAIVPIVVGLVEVGHSLGEAGGRTRAVVRTYVSSTVEISLVSTIKEEGALHQ